MKILVIGAGGVGGYFGAVLAKAGNEVTFLARGRHLTAMENFGLKISSPNGDFVLGHVTAVESLENMGPVDVILLAVKAWQVEDSARALNRMKANKFMIIPLQNGVESYDEVSAVVGPERTLGGTCKIISYIESPGHIVHMGVEPEITFGEWDNKCSARVDEFAACLGNAGIKYDVPENFQLELWKKFMFLASYAGVGSVTRAPIGRMRAFPESRKLIENAMREIVGLAHAFEIPLPEVLVDKSLDLIDNMQFEATSSMQRDVIDGKPSELHYLSGAVVRLAAQKGISVPTHKFIYSALLPGEMLARKM
jgi:2-dehydropantoate 2-reductase